MKKIIWAIIIIIVTLAATAGNSTIRADGEDTDSQVTVAVVITNFCEGSGEGYVSIRGPQSLNGYIILHAAIFTAGGIVTDIEEDITADYNPNGVGVGDYGFSYVGGWEGATSVVLYVEYTAYQGVFISENVWVDFSVNCSPITPTPPNYFDPAAVQPAPPPATYPATTLPPTN